MLCAGVAFGESKTVDVPAQLFEKANLLWIKGFPGDALEKFRTVYRKYPASPQAPHAAYHVARLYELNNEDLPAFNAYQELFDRFKGANYFNQVISGQIAAAERLLEKIQAQERNPLTALPKDFPDKKTVLGLFYQVVKNSGTSESTPKVQYRLAVALEQLGFLDDARKEHESLVDEFPQHYLADDALFQVAYIDAKRSRKAGQTATGSMSPRHIALMSLTYFTVTYPQSEKIPVAQQLMKELKREDLEALARTAYFYEKSGKKDAAKIYWKRVLEQPADFLEAAPAITEQARAAFKAEE